MNELDYQTRQRRLTLLHSVAAWHRKLAKDARKAVRRDPLGPLSTALRLTAKVLDGTADEMLETFEATPISPSSKPSDVPTSPPSTPTDADSFPG